MSVMQKEENSVYSYRASINLFQWVLPRLFRWGTNFEEVE